MHTKAVDKGDTVGRTPPKPEFPAVFCWTAAWSPALPIFSQAFPTFATNIFSRRRFHTNISILQIAVHKNRIFLFAGSVPWPKICQKAFEAGASPRTLLGELTTLPLPISRRGKHTPFQIPSQPLCQRPSLVLLCCYGPVCIPDLRSWLMPPRINTCCPNSLRNSMKMTVRWNPLGCVTGVTLGVGKHAPTFAPDNDIPQYRT